MTFELAPYSLALFEDDEIRKTKKSAFYDLFPEMTVNVNNVQKFSYVICWDVNTPLQVSKKYLDGKNSSL